MNTLQLLRSLLWCPGFTSVDVQLFTFRWYQFGIIEWVPRRFFFIFTAHIRRIGEGNVFNLSICSMWGGYPSQVPSPFSLTLVQGPFQEDTLVSGPISLLRGGTPCPCQRSSWGRGYSSPITVPAREGTPGQGPQPGLGHPPPNKDCGYPLARTGYPRPGLGYSPGPGQVTLRFPAGRTFLSILNFWKCKWNSSLKSNNSFPDIILHKMIFVKFKYNL